MRFCIHVIDDEENPSYGEKVMILFDSGGSEEERTDEDGNAFFERDGEEDCSFKLFIGHYDYGDQSAEDGDSLTFTIDEGVGTFKWTIHVVKADDEPAKWVKVSCHLGILRGHLTERTDDDGNAEFKLHTSRETESVQIYVNGEDQGEHTIEDGDSLTFNIAEDSEDNESDDD